MISYIICIYVCIYMQPYFWEQIAITIAAMPITPHWFLKTKFFSFYHPLFFLFVCVNVLLLELSSFYRSTHTYTCILASAMFLPTIPLFYAGALVHYSQLHNTQEVIRNRFQFVCSFNSIVDHVWSHLGMMLIHGNKML